MPTASVEPFPPVGSDAARRMLGIDDHHPLRAELLGTDRLEQAAQALAAAAMTTTDRRHVRLLQPRVSANAQALEETYRLFAAADLGDRFSVPAAQWMLDNFHIVHDQIREVRNDLPTGYQQQLPHLAAGPLTGYPRVYDLALTLIAHTDSRLDAHNLEDFVRAYQTVAQLSIGEVWAIPIMLRIGLVENLRRLADQALASSLDQREADALIERLLTHEEHPSALVVALADEVRRRQTLAPTLAVQLLDRLRSQPQQYGLARQWLEHHLIEQGMNLGTLIHDEAQLQTANQESVGNVITSMRLLSSHDWPDFVERVSLLEEVLQTDPAAIYGKMDFATRDWYRHSVEEIARTGALDEVVVAKQAIALARAAAVDDLDNRRRQHVGYFLIDRGRRHLERTLGTQPPPGQRLQRLVTDWAAPGYLAGVVLLTTLLLLVLASLIGPTTPLTLGLFLLLALLPSNELAIGLINWITAQLLPPHILPKRDLSDGIPVDCRTIVVVPMLLTDHETVASQLEQLEIRYQANRDDRLHLALLSDFVDADVPEQPGEAELLAATAAGIEHLNQRYGNGRADRFLLFHRPRRWNETQQSWLGWERKRGKLEEFNRLLRGATDTSFLCAAGDPSCLNQIRYVITLDADTQLPRGTAARLIGTLAHPLNAAQINTRSRRVEAGYGIIQPRISTTLTSAMATRFARLFAGEAGLDPYSMAVSDLYQDLFGEGTYIGKGIYEVDTFATVLAGRVPENALLSHDLFEGIFARVALATDCELFEDYPAQYAIHSLRQHRWVRGDWQLLPWLGATVPTAHGHAANDLPLLGRWKLLDNLRRSLVAPALVLLLVLGWLLRPESAPLWVGLVALVLGLPTLTGLLNGLLHLPRAIDRGAAVSTIILDLRLSVARTIVWIAFLAHQAYLNCDAIVRTLWRLLTRRRLLEWVTAAQTARSVAGDRLTTWRRMWPTTIMTLVVAGLLATTTPSALPWAAPLLVAWFIAPALADWLGRPPAHHRTELSFDQRRRLRRLARSTWRYFETFIGPGDRWLAPDNYQEEPKGELARRTSPTNLGLAVLSTLAAHDLGYITTGGLAERLERTLTSMDELERYRGHFLNWYDTETGRPLSPTYVSTVDSGNLAGHLIALRHGLLAVVDRPVIGPQVLEGWRDTIELLRIEAMRIPTTPRSAAVEEAVEALLELTRSDPVGLPGWFQRVADLRCLTTSLNEALAGAVGPPNTRQSELFFWAGRLTESLAAFDAELTDLAPIPDRGDAASMPIDPAPEKATGATPAMVPTLRQLAGSGEAARVLMALLERLADWAGTMVAAMDFTFLYDRQRDLFVIGYHVGEGRLDTSFYDLLASEARLASFLAIAKGDVPARHWFQLGRGLTRAGGERALLSWSGTMFEYLMPCLVMRTYPQTLLDQTYQAVIRRQIGYGAQRQVPWGNSEAAYAVFDLGLTYQYRAFGVPGLGLKRGLADDLVVAPYASMLAGPLAPAATLENLDRMIESGLLGRYGLYESVDYTPIRQPQGERGVIVRTFMVHHQGMILVTLDNWLQGQPMVDYFHRDPSVRATEMLLQERIPTQVPVLQPHAMEVREAVGGGPEPAPIVRRFTTAQTPLPRTHLLSNGTYSTVVTSAGGGYSTWRNLAVTRWREDSTRDHWGFFCYVRDLAAAETWSTGYQPTTRPPSDYEATFAIGKAEFRRRDRSIETYTEIAVSPEDHAEVRRVSLTNHGTRPCQLEVTSYAEIALAPAGADSAHPAFGNLFVETEFVPGPNALLCSRRPRAADQARPWVVHVLAVDERSMGRLSYETDRARFLGRGRSPANPSALAGGAPLTGTAGAVLDPIVSLRRTLELAPGETVRLAYTLAVAEDRGAALALADKYSHLQASERAIEMAWTYDQVELHHLNLTPHQAHVIQRLGAHLLFNDPSLRAGGDLLAANRLGQPGLWRFGISGDVPIVVVTVAEPDELPLVRELLLAHVYFRHNGLVLDLVIINEYRGGYLQQLQEQLQALILASPAQGQFGQHGGVFLLRQENLSEDDQRLFQIVARAVLRGGQGSLERQLDRPVTAPEYPRRFVPTQTVQPSVVPTPALPDLTAFNGLGGFSPDGREYVILLAEGRRPPAPWVNVIANPSFGCLTSEAGPGFTWSLNSRENRLTPWSNDPVSDPPGEVLYLRDEESGQIWTPTPRPIQDGGHYTIRHGQGYTIYEHLNYGIAAELTIFVAAEEPVRCWRLRLHNRSPRPRRLSATAYIEWVLGVSRESMYRFVVTERDSETGAILAHNSYNNEFAGRVAFVATSDHPTTYTADRGEFLGRNGSLDRPAALGRVGLSGRVGSGFDPCAALQQVIELAPGAQREVIFLLGEGQDRPEALALIERFRRPTQVAAALAAVQSSWENLLGTVQVETPDPALDLLLNRWLLYQVLSCRVWARSAFYQSGGAYGYRDQLQDVMALVVAAPELAREQILRAAARQFVEGDVQHWWHPPTGRGVRTRFSDDLLWLPYVTLYYLAATGDMDLLDEPAPYLEDEPLRPDEDERYTQPRVSVESGTIFEHCLRAVDRGLTRGPHGLPLMGAGDWNDGMNRVGHGGTGESVWVGWFLITILPPLAELCDRRAEHERAVRYRAETARLTAAIEEHAWDGAWYRRAYFDDGTPLGSISNDECRIDAIAQAWAVISGRADPDRMRRAMQSLDEHLVRERDGLILLLAPPFDRTLLDPGYIKGYLPGVRENGGQYTHAAIWAVEAFARLGQGDRAGQLFALINPINHARTPAEVERYKVEPYVVAADVYAVPPHTGRGGWSWYTGSAAWLYRLGLERLLGLRWQATFFTVEPCIPRSWPQFTLTIRLRQTSYRVIVTNPDGVESGVVAVSFDDQSLGDGRIPLLSDGLPHQVTVRLGPPPAAPGG